MLKFIDTDHPFYKPLWVRLLVVAFCIGWTAFEFWNGQTTWGMIFLAVAAYTTCALLIFYNPKPKPAEPSKSEDAP